MKNPVVLTVTCLGVMTFCVGCLAPPGYRTAKNVDLPDKVPAAPKTATQGAFETGVHRNLFVERGLDDKDVQSKVKAAYKQLFHGDKDTETIMYAVKSNKNGPMAYIKDIGSGDIRSEGMSYGMMIALQMDEKEDFDAIWNWARTYMYHGDETHPDHGYFSWQMNEDGTPMDVNPAPDGEEYFAMALYFAANRWGNGKGIFNYKAQADGILTDMVHREDITGNVNGDKGTTITRLMNTDTHMVRFTPNTSNFAANSDHTDPSYHLPSFYELWALWGPEQDKAFWKRAAQVSRDFFVTVTHPQTGLNPDYASFDGKPVAASWDKNTVDFRYDAFRTAMNWSMDCAWWAKDIDRQEELSNRIQAFFQKQGIDNYKATYTLNGRSTAPHRSTGLGAMNATASLCASTPNAWRFVDELWKAQLPTGKWRYYDGVLYMFGLLHVSGNYKIYKPGK